MRVESIGALRAAAALLVVYAHCVGSMDKFGGSSSLFSAMMATTNWFRIENNFAWFGVCLFYLISGYVITLSIQKETRRTFAIRRVLRIYPVLFIAAAVMVSFNRYEGAPWPTGEHLFSVLTLSGYPPQPRPLIGVEHTLFVEIKFYLITLLIAPLLRSRPVAAYALQATFLAIVAYNLRSFGIWGQPAVEFFIVTYLLFGQLMYFRASGRISLPTFIALTLVNYGLLCFGHRIMDPNISIPFNPTFISFYYVWAIMAVGVFWLHARSLPKPLRFLEDVSYSLYLLHGLFAVALIRELPTSLPYELRVLIGVSSALAVSWLAYRFVERPCIALGKRLTEGTRAQATRLDHVQAAA